MIIPQSIYDMWMNAHASAAMDSQVDLRGNSHDPSTVSETIYYVLSAFGLSADFADNPSREEIINWLTKNGRETEIEYLMEE